MSTITMTLPLSRRRSPAALGVVAAGALAVVALILILIQVTMFGFVPPIAGFAAAALVFAGLVAAGRRWAPALGALLGIALLAMFGPPILEVVSNPAIQGTMFPMMATLLAALAVGIVGGIAATVQNYRGGERRMPRLLPATLALLAGLIAGATAVALAPQEGMSVGINPETYQALPALETRGFEFAQKELHVKAGQVVMLRLSNADPEAHFLDIDELGVHAPVAPGKTSMAVFTAPASGSYLFYCHPHADKASGEGMVGRLIVDP
jgi:plastocyanin